MELDTFILKIFCILFCRGSTERKTFHLFDVINGPSGTTTKKSQVAWRGKRMVKAFKYLVYFSDIFPKKYWKQFMEPSNQQSLTSPYRMDNMRNSGFFSNHSGFSSDCFSKYSKPESIKLVQKSSDEIEDKPQTFPTGEDFFWSKEYVQAMD